jgi:hypothetical protein
MLPIVSKDTVESTAQSIMEDWSSINAIANIIQRENPDLLKTMFSLMKKGEKEHGKEWREGCKMGALMVYALLHRQDEADEMSTA